MCFLLYAGTERPIPRRAFDQNAPDIAVSGLEGNEALVRVHFTKSEVQNIGSTSCCGCDFPWAMYQNGSWPEIEYREPDEEQQREEQLNREGLFHLFETLDEDCVELYGVWAGNYEEEPVMHELIRLDDLRGAGFYFKENVFYLE